MAAIVALCAFPQRKEIWYDETISMLISKGIRHDTHFQFAAVDTLSSATLRLLNRPRHVYSATVKDMGNSLPYNIALHWLTRLFGNDIAAYTLLSKVSSVATLVALYVLATLLFEGGVFTSLAIVLLATDATFVLLSHEIRAYSLGTLFVVVAGIFFYKFMYSNQRPRDLFLTGLFSAAAVLTHFLSAYVALLFAAAIILRARTRLLSWKSITAMAVPVLGVAAYMYSAFAGLAALGRENVAVRAKLDTPFMLSEMLFRSAQLLPVDFRVAFPAFRGTGVIVLCSLLLIGALYAGAVRLAKDPEQRRRLHFLFLLGASGTVFLALVSVAAGHYSFLYYRYHSFGVPFACLFTTYALATLTSTRKVTTLVQLAVLGVVLVPAVALYATLFKNYRPSQSFSHVGVAKEIASDEIAQVAVPEWRDAFLLHALLPNGYEVRYLLDARSREFTLYEADGRVRRRARIRL